MYPKYGTVQLCISDGTLQYGTDMYRTYGTVRTCILDGTLRYVHHFNYCSGQVRSVFDPSGAGLGRIIHQ